MNVVELTRQLGAAIQQDERYLKFIAAREQIDKDPEILDKTAKIEEIRTEYQAAAMDPNPDEALLSKLDKDFQDIYAALMTSDKMAEFNDASGEVDKMMNYIMQILYLCVNGDDPATCEPAEEEHECGGECSHCSGC